VSDCGQVSGGYYLSSQANIDQISACRTIYGDIQIVPAPNDNTLNTISLPTTMTNITGSLQYMGFFDETDATSAINAPGLSAIGSINGAASGIYDGKFENYTLPWAAGANPGLLIYDFAFLHSLSFPALHSIGGDLLFAQNSLVQNINGFPNLVSVGGNLNLTGNFDSIDFPKLSSVAGNVYIQSSSTKFQCPSNLQNLGIGQAHCGSNTAAAGSTPTQTPTSSSPPPQRYELCKTEIDILNLQQSYGLIPVTATPTHSAFQPSYPETISSIAFAVFAIYVAAKEKKRTAAADMGTLVPPIVVGIFWTISFATIEHRQATGGWLSATDISITANFTAWAIEAGHLFIAYPFLLFWSFQGTGTWAIVIQRWKGIVGSVAYLISDTNGCTPYADLSYLEQGARSRAFKIIQTVEVVYASLILSVVSLSATWGFYTSGVRNAPGTHKDIRAFAATMLLLIHIPVLVYQSIIAVKGTPVAISGNCMLVELDPRWGFYDSRIENWWKIVVSITGL